MSEPRQVEQMISDLSRLLDEIKQSIKFDSLQEKLIKLDKIMAGAHFWDKPASAQQTVIERKKITSLLDPATTVTNDLQNASELFQLAIEENDQETAEEAAEMIFSLQDEMEKLSSLALLSQPHDNEGCFFSIHTGAGGSDACEWAQMLLRMYTRFFERKGWKCQTISVLPGEESGIKSAELKVDGDFAFGLMSCEIGVHRLVRISPFSGRRETSFAAIDVVPDFSEQLCEVEIQESDLKVETQRASGKGGQHVNTTDSAVRITHLPTGVSAYAQTERSQHSNRNMAMQVIRAKISRMQEQERLAKATARNAAKSDNAWGSQIRNYVLNPYTMVKDARTSCQTADVYSVLDGAIGEFIDSCLRWRAIEDRF